MINFNGYRSWSTCTIRSRCKNKKILRNRKKESIQAWTTEYKTSSKWQYHAAPTRTGKSNLLPLWAINTILVNFFSQLKKSLKPSPIPTAFFLSPLTLNSPASWHIIQWLLMPPQRWTFSERCRRWMFLSDPISFADNWEGEYMSSDKFTSQAWDHSIVLISLQDFYRSTIFIQFLLSRDTTNTLHQSRTTWMVFRASMRMYFHPRMPRFPALIKTPQVRCKTTALTAFFPYLKLDMKNVWDVRLSKPLLCQLHKSSLTLKDD